MLMLGYMLGFVSLFALALHMRRLSLVSLTLCLVLSLRAQELVLRPLNEDRGLPSNCVLTLHVDRTGLLWVSTNKGLYRYDGFDFELVGGGTPMDEVNILTIKEVPELDLFIFVGAGMRLFLLEGEQVVEVPIHHPDWIVHDIGTLTGLAVDSAFRLHAGLEESAGRLIVDLRTRRVDFERPFTRNTGHVQQVNGQITTWIGKRTDPLVLTDTIDLPAFRGKVAYRASKVQTSFLAGALTKGRAWYTHHDQLHFLHAGRITSYTLPDRLLGVTEDSNGRIWARIWDHSVRCFGPDFDTLPLRIEPLHRTHVTACVEDQQGGLWFSTIDRGLFHCAAPEVLHFSTRRDFEAPWASCLLGLPDGQVVVGTGNGSVHRLTGLGEARTVYRPQTEGHALEVKSLLFSEAGQLYPGRLDRTIDPTSGRTREFPQRPARWIGVYDLAPLPDGRYLKASIMSLELISLAPEERTLRIINTDRSYRIIPDPSSGGHLIATHRGIRRYTFHDTAFRSTPFAQSDTRTYDLLWCSDTLWAATHHGLMAYLNDAPRPDLVPPLLRGTQVRALSTESRRWLWVATLDGLYRFDIHRPAATPQRFGRAQGLPSDATYDVLVHHNTLWVISGPDVATFPLHSPPKPATPAPLSVVGILGNGVIAAGTRPRFDHTVDRVSIALRNLDYARTTRTPFRYRTSPTSAWTLHEGPQLQLLGLAPGAYDVEIQAIDADGVWGGTIHAQWSITPPFWATLWFQVIVLLFLTSIITLAIYQYTARKQRMARLAAEARYHHHKALLAQLEPHFVFNALNSIQSFVAANDAPNSTRYLAKFAKLMRGLLNAAHNETVSLQEEMEVLEHYCALEALRQQPTFTYTVKAHEALTDRPVRFPSFLVQPYVENAIRHGLRNLPPDRRGELLIHFEPHGPLAMRCTVQDNGIGRAAASRLSEKTTAWRSLGTLVNQQRLPLLSRMVTEGTFSIETTDLTDADGTSRGTRVEIIVPITPATQ
jgi:hypothetical protein